jgi:hypothetical protein
MNSQAETKPFKFGEPLSVTTDGNPEPSRSGSPDPACVETRRRVCIKCQGTLPSTRNKLAKYCSDKCRNAYIAYQYCLRHGKFKKPGSGSGGNQSGTDNHMYRTGIGDYSKRGFEHYGRICNRCQSTKFVLVHHKDEDRTNNDLTNLEVLCKRCHQKHHETRDLQGKYTKG